MKSSSLFPQNLIYTYELPCIYENSTVNDEGKIMMSVHDHTMLLDEDFIASLIHLPSEGISSFSDISNLDIEEMQVKFSASRKSVKISDAKRELKYDYHLLDDIAAKGILTKFGSFAALLWRNFRS